MLRAGGRSGHTPALHGVLPACAELPRGGLIVEEIVGRAATLPRDLGAIARALAALHGLPLPPAGHRRAPGRRGRSGRRPAKARSSCRPGTSPRPTWSAPRAPRSTPASTRCGLLCARPARPAKALISFDAHPGNFIVRADGEAVLVDLEKCRYSHAPLDLAHATLYTSTTWDIDQRATLTPAEVAGAYAAWGSSLGPRSREWLAWHLPLRRAMWLWSVTWCAKWRVVVGQPAADTRRRAKTGRRRPARARWWSTSASASTITCLPRASPACWKNSRRWPIFCPAPTRVPRARAMIDRQATAAIRPAIDALARALVRAGVGADALSFVGLAVGWLAALAIALQFYAVGAAAILLSRLFDGLDGAVARQTTPTDRGGFLDISLDFLFYPAIPLAFAVADPLANALAAAVLLAAFVGTGTCFLAFAVLAAKRGLASVDLPGQVLLFSRRPDRSRRDAGLLHRHVPVAAALRRARVCVRRALRSDHRDAHLTGAGRPSTPKGGHERLRMNKRWWAAAFVAVVVVAWFALGLGRYLSLEC